MASFLDQTAICHVCGAPYLKAAGHDCPRLRGAAWATSAPAPRTARIALTRPPTAFVTAIPAPVTAGAITYDSVNSKGSGADSTGALPAHARSLKKGHAMTATVKDRLGAGR